MSLSPPGVFTTARVAGGRIVARALHRERLLRAGAPAALVDGLLARADEEARRIGEGMVRVLVRAGADGPSGEVEAGPARRSPFRSEDRPLALITRRDPREGSALLVKAVERGALSMLEAEARGAGADGALLIDEAGLVREGTFFALIARVGSRWVAPPYGEGVIFSTTRERFSAHLGERGEALEERPLALSELLRAEGALALSSLLGAAPVGAVDDVRLPPIDPPAAEALLLG